MLSAYVEWWWTPILGTSSISFARHVGHWLKEQPEMYVAPSEMDKFLGFERVDTLAKAIDRLCGYGLASWRAGVLELQVMWPDVPREKHHKLPISLLEAAPNRRVI